ncbi:uncharacterized protein LOC126728234 [Quercus robur]|uniref:uncharacterized protein LOC126728234 n=1 Tax=Quercus robur TaxID=38942 RepID=UPI00216385E5|nr:uncharacterized protein LOC126728234 [Quercus robur]
MDQSQSLNAPPFFDGSNYAFWKVCMRAFFCAIDESVWDSVENRISHVKTAKEAWMILKTTYEDTKKVKDMKLQMLTTRFEELKMGDDESFDSFYGKLNEIVTAIEESKDLDEIKIQELIGSFQTYELGLPSHKTSKSLALKTITERMDDSFEEDDVEKEVAFIANNFRKFLKMKNSGKPFSKGRFSSSKGDRKEFKKKDGKEFQSPQGIVCYKCNGHGHLKKECPNYLRGKGKVFATTLSDSDRSNSDTEGECDSEGNYRAFMTIAFIDSKNDLSNLVDELGEINLQEAYDSLLEDCGKYAKIANLAVKKMKKVEEEHRCILVQHKEAKCEVERLKGELVEAYSKIKFLELEIIQANVKVERISTKKLNNVVSSQKSSHDKTGLG